MAQAQRLMLCQQERCAQRSVYFAATHATYMYIGTHPHMRTRTHHMQTNHWDSTLPRYSRWKIKSEREGSSWHIPRHPTDNVEHPGEVCRMEEINQSVDMGARPLPTFNIVRRGTGVSTHERVDALILFSIYCLACRFCVFWVGQAHMHAQTHACPTCSLGPRVPWHGYRVWGAHV